MHRIQYVYLEFKNKEQAAKAYAERKELFTKEEARISCLYEGMDEFMARPENAQIQRENVLVVYKPSTSLRLSATIPAGIDRPVQLLTLLSIITGLDKETIKVVSAANKITGEPNNDQIFVVLPNKNYVQQVYASQPLFKELIADKLVHAHYYVELKADRLMCARCSLPRVPIQFLTVEPGLRPESL